MESNNPNLGDDMPREEDMPEAEHTPAEPQAVPEESADLETPQIEAVEGEAIAYDEAAVLDEAVASDMVPPEPESVLLADDELIAGPVMTEFVAEAEAPDVTDEVIEDEAIGDEVIEDEVIEDEAIGDEAIEDEITGDEADKDETYEEEVVASAEEAGDDADQAEPGPHLKRGEIVEGTVYETSPTEVLVDLGEGLIGVVASRELERMDRAALEALQVGSPVMAFVLKARGADRRPVLSLARAEEENNWRLAEEHHQRQEVYFSKVAGYNKGGLIVRFGKVRGFVPASQVSRERQRRASGNSPEERWGGMVGDEIAVKVVEIDRARNRLILSERAAAREWREKQKARLLENLQVGEVRTGRVISVADFGAFVDLGGADGLVHLTELSWQHVTHPREVVEVGQQVEVQVINIDRERKRIGLSMKRQEDDPWHRVARNYDVGQLVQATVTKLTKFGAFARLVDAPEIEGLIHISELADYRVSHPREVVLVGDVLTLRIVKIDVDQRRLGLSLRQVDSAKYMDQDWQFLSEDMAGELDGGPPTIGEMVDYQPEAEADLAAADGVSEEDMVGEPAADDEPAYDDADDGSDYDEVDDEPEYDDIDDESDYDDVDDESDYDDVDDEPQYDELD